jgi:hypothetical protein
MARKPGPGRCVHCLKDVDRRNWDHVFPVSWYPDSTPQNLEKWKIPTCKPCNDEYGRIEEDFGQILSFCVDPKRIESQGVYKRMLRAYDPRHAKTVKDAKIREAKRQKLLSKMMHGDEIPNQGIYPGLGERWNRPREEQIALMVPKRYFDRLGIKIVRGIAYIKDGIFIEEEYEIEPHAVEETGAQIFEEAIAQFGHSLSRGPGIVVDRAVTKEDGVSSIYKITIWGEMIIYLSVLRRERNA